MTVGQDPFGRVYRAGRLSDEETARRMIAVASERVRREGLRVNFDLLRFEDLIVEAGVARSAVYRRWETKGHFYAELFLELAGYVHPAIAADDWGTIMKVVHRARDSVESLRTEQGRRWLAVELCRVGAVENFELLTESSEWPVYLCLVATLISTPSTDFHESLREALGNSERTFLNSMGMFYNEMFQYLGYRLREDLRDLSPVTMGQLGAGIITGMGLTSISTPEISQTRYEMDPFQTGDTAQWTLYAIGFTSMAMTLVEPDPERVGEWGDARIEECQRVIDSLEQVLIDLGDEAQLRAATESAPGQ